MTGRWERRRKFQLVTDSEDRRSPRRKDCSMRNSSRTECDFLVTNYSSGILERIFFCRQKLLFFFEMARGSNFFPECRDRSHISSLGTDYLLEPGMMVVPPPICGKGCKLSSVGFDPVQYLQITVFGHPVYRIRTPLSSVRPNPLQRLQTNQLHAPSLALIHSRVSM